MEENRPPETNVVSVDDPINGNFDGIIFITDPDHIIENENISNIVEKTLKINQCLYTEPPIVLNYERHPNKFIFASTGNIDVDYDDVTVIFKKTAVKALEKSIKIGIKKPLLIIEKNKNYKNTELNILLGALEGLYCPIQVREFNPSKKNPIDYLSIYEKCPTQNLIKLATLLESGRRVACDIGDADPERMSPIKIETYINNIFKDSPIKITTIKNINEIKENYPLFEAVNRAASQIERHQGRIIFLEYNPIGDNVKETLFLIGKGVTYDTGGLDIKINSAMCGMSRDKCGAAAIIGFMELVKLIQPKNIRVIAGVGLVRNSVGSNGYVADEIITARSGVRVRIVNTDAEGRLIMADILCKCKEMALEAINPQLFTVATLTGHAFLTVGKGYSIAMDNGPAKQAKVAQRLQENGNLIGDPFEISTIRREDFNFVKGIAIGDDIVQSNKAPSSRTPRGHQGPAAFLIMASGLNKHGTLSKHPLKFTHLDVAGSAGDFPDPATGSPILTLAQTYLIN